MVKNIPTIERSTKIRFGKHATDDQAENTIVFNASNVAIDASTAGGVYITPMRTVDPSVPEITVLSYNTVTKEIVNSNTASADLFNANLQFVSQRGNVTSNTLEFINPTTAFVTTGNVGIQNTSPTHALDIGSQFHVTDGGEVRVGPSVLIDSSVTNQIQVAGRIDTDSITLDHIGLSNNNPTITGLSLGSSTFLQHPSESINAFSTTGNVSAAFYHGDSYFLSNLTLDNIILQGNTAASKTVEFNKSGTSLITASNVGIANALPVHTLDVGSNLFVDEVGSNVLVVTGNTYTSRKALVGSNVTIDTLGSNVVEVTGNTFTSRKALIGSNVTIDTLGSNVVEVTGNTYTSRKALIGSNVTIDTLGSNVVEVTGNTYTSRKALVGSNVTIDTLGSNVVEVTGNTFTSRKVLVGSNVTIDTLRSNVVEVTGNTYTSRKALVGSNLVMDTLGSNVVEVTGNTFTSRKALVGSNLIMDTLGSNVVEVTGNVNVSNYTKTDYITVQKDAHVKGNLLVEGTTTTIDTINTTFGDAVISLANNNTETSTDIGIIMKQPNSNASPTVTFRGDEKEIMIGYTLNNSLDTEITPDSANVIDLHVYGNVIAQNNITLTSGELTAITLNGNVVGNNVDVVTLTGNVIGNNVDVITLTGNVIGNNVDVITLYGNVIGNNVDVVTLTGNVIGNNVNAITLYGNVIADNVYATNNIETTSGFFKGDGGILSNVTLQQVTDTSNSTSNTVLFTNAHTAFTTDLTSNVGVKLGQLSNVIITDPNDHKSLLYIDGNWIDDYIDFTSIEVKAGETLSKGDVVYINDGSGDTPEVRKADSSSASTMPAIGIVMDGTINQNNNGHVVTFGTFGMTFDTNFQKGEILYVSNTTPGGLMNTVPFNNTDKIQNVGIVVKSGEKILVTGVGRSNDIPNAEEVYAQPTYVYVNSSGNELKKILASNLSANNQTLDMVTSWSNSTQNTIQSTHATTGFISAGNVHVGSNIFVSGIKDPSGTGISYIPMIENGTGKLIRSPAHVDNDGTYIITAANAEFTGNLSFTGNTYVFESNTVVINDRILGIANNNTSHTLDVGIIMEHPGHNIAFIHHGEPEGGDLHEHEMVLGYTQNTVSDNHVLDDANLITFRVLGDVIVQNNLTLTSGDLTAITLNGNVVGDTANVITLNGNVVDNVVATNGMYGTIAGANTISASTISALTTTSNVVADNVVATNGMYGTIAGSNTISASTISALTTTSNVVADNVVAMNRMYGTIAGANTISASTISALTTTSNVVADNVVATNGMYGTIEGANTISASTINAVTVNSNVVATNMYGTIAGSNTINASTINAVTVNSNVVSDNVVATNGMYGTIAGSNTISASTIYVGTSTYDLNGYDLRVEGDTEITGNLLVGGTTTTVNTENLIVKDPIIQLGDASASVDSGLLLVGSSNPAKDNVYVGYDQSRTEFAIGFTDNHAGDSDITIKQGEDFTLNVYGNVEANYLFGNGSQLSGIQTATPNLHDVVNVDNVTSNVVQFSNATTGIKIASNIAFDDKITLQSLTSGSKNGFFVVDTIQLDPSYASPTRNVLSYDTTTGQIYDSGGQGGSSFQNITEQDANVFIGSNLIINTYGSNVLTVGGNIYADNLTLGSLTIQPSEFGLDDIVSSAPESNVTTNVLSLGGVVTDVVTANIITVSVNMTSQDIDSNVITANTISVSGNTTSQNIESNVITANIITLTNNLTVSGNTTSQNIKLTNTDITASVTSGTITIDAKEKTYGTAPLLVSTSNVSNLIFSNLITGAQIVIPILASGSDIEISNTMTNVNFYAMTSNVSITQDKHGLMTLSNLYGNIYMNATGFS
jgi:hypothetical protein